METGDLFDLAEIDPYESLARRLESRFERLPDRMGLPDNAVFVSMKRLKNNGLSIRIGINEPVSPFGEVDRSLKDSLQGFLRLEKPKTKKDGGNIFIWTDSASDDGGAGDSKRKVVKPLDDDVLPTFIESLVIGKIEEYVSANQPRFACCQMYAQCSVARRCIHPNRLFASACAYGRNLREGKVFYGGN